MPEVQRTGLLLQTSAIGDSKTYSTIIIIIIYTPHLFYTISFFSMILYLILEYFSYDFF